MSLRVLGPYYAHDSTFKIIFSIYGNKYRALHLVLHSYSSVLWKNGSRYLNFLLESQNIGFAFKDSAKIMMRGNGLNDQEIETKIFAYFGLY